LPGLRERQEELHDRADRQGVQHRSDAHGAAEDEADRQDADLDDGPPEPHAASRAPHEAQPEAVARTRTQLGTDVDRTGEAVADHATDEEGAAQPRVVGLVDDGDAGIGREPDHDDVEDRADSRHLAQRDPQQEHDGPHEDDDLTEGQRQVARQSFVEDVPRVQTQGRLDHHRHREAVEEQSDEQTGKTVGHVDHQTRLRYELGRSTSPR